MIAVRLSPEMESRLERLARETRRSKSYDVKEALARYLAEREETLLALSRMEIAGGRLRGSRTYRPAAGHEAIDRRSLAMHRLIARRLREDPGLIDLAKDNIRRWRRQGVDVRAFREWEVILARGSEATARFLRSNTEEAIRLRHSTPFTGILTPGERRRFFAKKPA